MAFIITGGIFRSFAEYSDVVQLDSRFFSTNEGLTEDSVEQLLELASQRILSRIRASSWWADYNFSRNTALNNDKRLLPDVNGKFILGRRQDWTDLCVYFALQEYIYPKYADFGNADSSEVRKMALYKERYDDLWRELIEDGSWYDFSQDGVIQTSERESSRLKLVRVR